jgi:hypothetical protein
MPQTPRLSTAGQREPARGVAARPPVCPGRKLFITGRTSARDGYEHAVSDEEATRGFHEDDDPEAVCGHRVAPMPLETPQGQPCPECVRFLRARASLPTVEQRTGTHRMGKHRHCTPSSWLARVLTRRATRRQAPAPRRPDGAGLGGSGIPADELITGAPR